MLESYCVPEKFLYIFLGRCKEKLSAESGARFRRFVANIVRALLDLVMMNVNNSPREIGSQQLQISRLDDLHFANDICLMSHSIQEMAENIGQLYCALSLCYLIRIIAKDGGNCLCVENLKHTACGFFKATHISRILKLRFYIAQFFFMAATTPNLNSLDRQDY